MLKGNQINKYFSFFIAYTTFLCLLLNAKNIRKEFDLVLKLN